MCKNKVQFQKGLSLPGFMDKFGTEVQCEAALEDSKWPDGSLWTHQINLSVVKGFRTDEIKQWSENNLKAGSSVYQMGYHVSAVWKRPVLTTILWWLETTETQRKLLLLIGLTPSWET